MVINWHEQDSQKIGHKNLWVCESQSRKLKQISFVSNQPIEQSESDLVQVFLA